MADVHSIEIRSFNMSRIRSKDTKPEILVRKFLHSKGFRFRLHDKKLPGKPDIILPKFKTIIFVNGCFWHGHENCKYFKIPKTRSDWWAEKINKNIVNDLKVIRDLTEQHFTVINIWECSLKPKNISATLEKLYNRLITTSTTA